MSKLRKILIGELSWKRLLYSILSIYLILLVVAVFFAHKLIFFPPQHHYSKNLEGLELIEDGKGGKIALVNYPSREGMPTLLWSHGNAEDIGQLTEVFEAFNRLGYGVVAYDYPGYGLSTGSATESTCCHAADKVWDHLLQNGKQEKDIVLVGQSVGSGPAVYLASKHQPSSVVLLAPLTSVYRAGIKYPLFPRDRFPNIKRIKEVTSPLLVIHGENDAVIPQNHGRQLIANHSGPNKFVSLEETNHNDIYFNHLETVVQEIRSFTKEHYSSSE